MRPRQTVRVMTVDAPGQSPELLIQIIQILNSRHIDYAVIGAMAVSVHGIVRASVDADALVSATYGQLNDLSKELTAMGLTTELRRGDVADPIPAMMIVSDQYENRVDLLMGLRGLDPGVYERAQELSVPELSAPLRFAAREDLIAMKLFAGGPQDLIDAQRVIAVAGAVLDMALLRKLVARYGRDAIRHCEVLLKE